MSPYLHTLFCLRTNQSLNPEEVLTLDFSNPELETEKKDNYKGLRFFNSIHNRLHSARDDKTITGVD